MNLFENLCVFYGTKCNKIVLYLRINAPINSFVNKELFYGTKCNKIPIIIIKNIFL